MARVRALRRRFAAEDGFTLTELLVVIPLMVAALGISTVLVSDAFTQSNVAASRSSATSKVQVAMTRMARDLRGATALSFTSVGGTVTATMSIPTRSTTGLLTPGSTSVSWACTAGATCTRQVGTGAVETVLPGLVSAAFIGFTSAGAATTSNPASLDITLSARNASVADPTGAKTAQQSARPVTVHSIVNLRNFSS